MTVAFCFLTSKRKGSGPSVNGDRLQVECLTHPAMCAQPMDNFLVIVAILFIRQWLYIIVQAFCHFQKMKFGVQVHRVSIVLEVQAD